MGGWPTSGWPVAPGNPSARQSQLQRRRNSVIKVDVRERSAVDAESRPGNDDFDWNGFDSEAYFEHNYNVLHAEDREIIDIVADHFQEYAPPRWFRARAIDVGAGANLYPALTMLPFVGHITLSEPGGTNREWLKSQLEKHADSWDQFWKAISDGRPDYLRLHHPFDRLRNSTEVVSGNVFALEQNHYDMGTMFFVAESITSRLAEFERATRNFIGSLVTGAPFAAAFMRDSAGYTISDKHFPACAIEKDDVERCLADVAFVDDIQVVMDSSDPLREGYSGMIVATGRKR
jgi:hypothetical protein